MTTFRFYCSSNNSLEGAISIAVPQSIDYIMFGDNVWTRWTPADIQLYISKLMPHKGRPYIGFPSILQEEKIQSDLMKALDIFRAVFDAMKMRPFFWMFYDKERRYS